MSRSQHPLLSVYLLFLVVFLASRAAIGQSLNHPHIWVDNSDKQRILDNINQYEWAGSMYDQLIARQQNRKNTHAANPLPLLDALPPIPGDRTALRISLNDAVECAILYWLTEDEGYAQVSADILHYYVQLLAAEDDPVSFDFYTPYHRDNHLISTREKHPRIAMIYDFVEPFLRQPGTTVYDTGQGGRIPFNFAAGQACFKFLADNVLQKGGGRSNHSVLELTGGIYPTLCLADDAERAHYYNQFWTGTLRQAGINWMLDNFSDEEDLWPEAFSYAKGTQATFIKAMNVIDRYDPSASIVTSNQRILEAIFTFENFNYPNNLMVAFGDSNRGEADNSDALRMVLAISDRKNLMNLRQQSMSTLKGVYDRDGGYQPIILNQRLEWTNPLQLLWGVNIPATTPVEDSPIYTTTTAKFAGVVMQRNYVEQNNEENALMYYTGGGTYIHAHATGIDLEIYGAGHIIGPDYSTNSYSNPLHEIYDVNHAAHNTVIVNGTSQRATPSPGPGTWVDIVNEVVLEAVEPANQEEPISSDFCFSTQFLDDNINDCDQQRTNAIIRTSPTTGYYLDVFRSLSNGANNFHDYIFHGLGDEVTIRSRGAELAMSNTPGRYQTQIDNPADTREQPGWRQFTQTRTSAVTNGSVTARFDLNTTGKYLHLHIPESIEREYSHALAPATPGVGYGYHTKPTQVMTMRKYGEAWDKPFVATYEPSGNASPSVVNVDMLRDNNRKTIGVMVNSVVDGQDVFDYVLTNDTNGSISLPNMGITFTGRFGIVRLEPNGVDTTVTLYIGAGSSLTYRNITLSGGNDNKAVNTYLLQPGETDFWFEAECAEVGSAWSLLNDGNASEGQALTYTGSNATSSAPTAASAHVRFSVDVSQAGSYEVYTRSLATNTGDDSYWVRANNGSWVRYNSVNFPSYPNAYAWDQVGNWPGGNVDNVPVSFNLSAGINTIDFAYRENGIVLDKIFVTLNQDAPDGLGATADGCSPSCIPGTVCDDNDPCTTNDAYTANCECVGTFADSDGDGVCNAEDQCPGFNNGLIGTACNDGNANTVNDVYTNNCDCVGTPGGGSGTITLDAIHDAYLRGSTRYNTTELRVENGNRVSYLMFDLSSVPGLVTSAELTMKVGSDGGNGTITVAKGSSNNWTETNLSTSNRPSGTGQIGSLNTSYISNNQYTWDMTASAFTGNTISLIVTHNSGNDVSFISSENSDVAGRPKLVLTYAQPLQIQPGTEDRLESKQTAALLDIQDLMLYPNPASEQVSINVSDFSLLENASLQLFNAAGQVLVTLPKVPSDLDVSQLPRGLYFVKITLSDKQVLMKKLVLIR